MPEGSSAGASCSPAFREPPRPGSLQPGPGRALQGWTGPQAATSGGRIVLPPSSPVPNKFLFPEARSQGNSLALPPRAVLGSLLVTDRDLMRTEALGVFPARGYMGLARRTFPTLHQCSGGNGWPQEDGLLGTPRFRNSHGVTLST